MRICFAIVTYESETTLAACLASILAQCEEEDTVCVVDSASCDSSTAIIAEFARLDSRVKLKINTWNTGYSSAANQAISMSTANVVVFLNPDAVLHSNFRSIAAHLLEDKSIGAVGPLCDQVSGRQFVRYHLPAGFHGAAHHISEALGQAHAREVEETKLLMGFCLAVRRETLEEVGVLDENCFLGSDDLELSWRLRQRGYKLLIAKDCFVEHKHGTSFKSLPADQKREWVHQSNMALLDKLRNHYGDLSGITSMDLWDSHIFDPVLVHDESRVRAQQSIPGWFDFRDIYDAIVAGAEDGAQFVEVGCWLGRSTCYLAQAILRSGKNIKLTVIDTFEGVPGDELQALLEPYGGSVFEAFRENLRLCSVETVVSIIKENSRYAHRHFRPGSIDFLFIDGDHSYEGVKADIQNFLPKIRHGGHIGGHDYTEAPGVKQAVNEVFGHCPASNSSWLVRIENQG